MKLYTLANPKPGIIDLVLNLNISKRLYTRKVSNNELTKEKKKSDGGGVLHA